MRFILTAFFVIFSWSHLAAQEASDRVTVLILDESGSMWAQLPDGQSRVEVARDVLDDFLRARPAAAQLGVVAYGHNRKGDCSDISVIAPVGPQDGRVLGAQLRALSPKGKTPLADALRLAAAQIPATAEAADIVLVTDGLETCGGDPCAVAAELAQSGLALRAHIVGFGLTEGEIQQIACVAEQTGGQVLSTQSGAELSDALIRTTTATAAQPAAPGLATIGLTIRADIAGRPDRVTFRGVSEQTGAAVEFGTLDFTQADVLPVELGEGNWLITADAGDAGNGEVVATVAAGDNRTIYVPFRGLLPVLDMTPPVGAMRAGASGVFPHRILAEGLSVGGADFQLTLLPADATSLADRPITWSAQDGRLGAYVARLNLPQPGTYLVAYHRYGEKDLTKALALFPLDVAARPEVTLIAPDAVAPGAVIPVTFTGGMAHADRLEVWKDGQIYSWDQSVYVEEVFDNAYGAGKPLTAPAEPGDYELVYVFSDMSEPDNVAARQPLQVGDGISFDEAALVPDPAADRCDDDTGCAMGEDAPQPGSGVVPVTITATGYENAPVDWFAQPIGRPDALSLGSGGPVTGPWTTALDVGSWALTGIAEDATFFAEIEVSDTGAQQFAITRDLPADDVEMDGEDIAFLCETGGICVFEDTDVGILFAMPEGWAVDFPTREAATAGGDRGFVRLTVFNTADPADTIVLNPHQWITMNGPCIDVQAGALCHFDPASEATLAAIEVIRRSIRDTAPRNSPSPAEALAQVMGDLAKDDPAAAAAMGALVGAASGAGNGDVPDLGAIIGAVTGGAAATGANNVLPTQGEPITADQFDQLRQQLTGN